MSRIVFLLEEPSMKTFLEVLLPRLFPDLAFLCVAHEGRTDLEKSIPRKLRAWHEPDVRFVVVRDNDWKDCREVKRHLEGLCVQGNREDVLVRIACQELEAWYFGDPNALATVYASHPQLRRIASRARFRDPDSIDRPGAELTRLVAEFQKLSGARRMAQVLTRDNRSRSYRVLITGIERLTREMGMSSMLERDS